MNHKPISISICALALVISASSQKAPRCILASCDALRGTTREMRAGKVT